MTSDEYLCRLLDRTRDAIQLYDDATVEEHLGSETVKLNISDKLREAANDLVFFFTGNTNRFNKIIALLEEQQ